VKFYRRSIEKITNMFRKLKQTKPRKSDSVNNSTTSEKIAKNENVNDLATVILGKIGDAFLERLRSELKNKESGVNPVALSDPLAIREEGIENQHENKLFTSEISSFSSLIGCD